MANSVRVSEVVAPAKSSGTKQLTFSVKDGVGAVMTCDEIDGSVPGTERAAASMRKITEGLWNDTASRRVQVRSREGRSAACTGTYDVAKAENQAMVARARALAMIKTAQRTIGSCSSAAQNSARILKDSDVGVLNIQRHGKLNAGMWNTYCNQYAGAAEFVENSCK